jgi:hypothetical protein
VLRGRPVQPHITLSPAEQILRHPRALSSSDSESESTTPRTACSCRESRMARLRPYTPVTLRCRQRRVGAGYDAPAGYRSTASITAGFAQWKLTTLGVYGHEDLCSQFQRGI